MNAWTKTLLGVSLTVCLFLCGSARAQVSYRLADTVDLLDASFYAGQPEDGSNVAGRQAFFSHSSHDGKRVAFWAVDADTLLSSFFVVDVGAPDSYRRITPDYEYSPSAPIYWTPDDSALLVGAFRIVIPPAGQLSNLEQWYIDGKLINDVSVTSLPTQNWAISLTRDPEKEDIVALPILSNGSWDPSRQSVYLTDFEEGTMGPDWPSVSPDGTKVTFVHYYGYAEDIMWPDHGDIFLLNNVQDILAAPLRPGTNISSLAVANGIYGNLVPIRADESDNFAHSPTFSQDASLVFYMEDYNNVFADRRFFETFPLADCDIVISNSDGLSEDFRLAQPGNQAFTTSVAGGIRVVYDSEVGGAMHLFMSSIEAAAAVYGTYVPNNNIVTIGTQEVVDGSGTRVTVPAGTTIDFPDGAPREIQILTPVNPLSQDQLPPDIAAIPVLRDFGPEGTTFSPAITITISYTDAEVAGLDENALRVFRYNPATGKNDDEITSNVVRDPEHNRISFSVTHFSAYGLGGATDTDADGIGDSADPDDDNDGILDALDPMPLDTDNDGLDNGVDTDDDSDGILDMDDPEPYDTDNDHIANSADLDGDNDGILDSSDSHRFDTDNDGENNAVDLDDDGDGLTDILERYTLLTNPLSSDTDGDGVSDLDEIFAGTDFFLKDTDGDWFTDGEELAAGSSPILGTSIPYPVGDVDHSSHCDALDVQAVINGALGKATPYRTDIDLSGRTNAADVQLVINAVLHPRTIK